MSFWPKSSPKGARRTKLAAPDPATKPAPPARKRAVRLTTPKPAVAKPKKSWSMQIGAGSLLGVLVLFGLLLAWGAGMTFILIFGDKLSARLIAQNSEMQDAYEQRLQVYRDEVRRVIEESKQSEVDKDSVIGRVRELIRRQNAIENRQNLLNKLADQIGGDPGAAAAATPPQQPATEAPMPPVRPGAPTRAPGQRGEAVTPFASEWAQAGEDDSRPLLHRAAARSDVRTAQFLEPPTIDLDAQPTQADIELERQIGRLERAVAVVEAAQIRSISGMAGLSEFRLESFRNALNILGLTAEGIAPESNRPSAALAGLLIPLAEENTAFGARMKQIRGNVSLLARLRPAIAALPVARPTSWVRLASPFGYRIHPISGVRRLHAGLDLAAPLGTPIRAAGAGVVLSAGWAGGYGNLVQIDHGNGVVSRYGHMSAIEVAQGQPVAAGGQVGLMGSTGASTGSHLHFETRIKGAPTNPTCFLLAGDRLRAAPNPGFVCDKPPFHETATQEDEDDDS